MPTFYQFQADNSPRQTVIQLMISICLLENPMSEQFQMFTDHVKYLENLDISSIATGVKHSLRKHIDFWSSIGASKFVIDTIQNGYVIPFITTPPPMSFKNNKSTILYSEFVDEAIADLIESGCVVKTPFQPFSVAVQSSGKKRLILDLSEFNNFVKKD